MRCRSILAAAARVRRRSVGRRSWPGPSSRPRKQAAARHGRRDTLFQDGRTDVTLARVSPADRELVSQQRATAMGYGLRLLGREPAAAGRHDRQPRRRRRGADARVPAAPSRRLRAARAGGEEQAERRAHLERRHRAPAQPRRPRGGVWNSHYAQLRPLNSSSLKLTPAATTRQRCRPGLPARNATASQVGLLVRFGLRGGPAGVRACCWSGYRPAVSCCLNGAKESARRSRKEFRPWRNASGRLERQSSAGA